MRFTLRRSPSLTNVDVPNLRFRLWALDVRMWRRPECPRFTLPVAVFLKRLAAPLCVFNFGIFPQDQPSAFSRQPSVLNIQLLLICSGIGGGSDPRPFCRPITLQIVLLADKSRLVN